MTWSDVLILLLVFGGAGLLWHALYAAGDVTPCIGCGECLAAGHCTQVKKGRRKRTEKAAVYLDKTDKKDIMISVKEQNAMTEPALPSGTKREGRR